MLCVALAGCGYRLSAPHPLGEPLSISVAGSQARLVRTQALLHEEVGRSIRRRLGWAINPTAEARLNLLVERESIDAAARDVDGVAINWTITIRASAVLSTTHHGTLSSPGTFIGVGNSSGRNNEAQALRNASKNLSSQVADWLEHLSSQWHEDDEDHQE